MIWFITTLENPVNQKFGNGLGLYFGKIEDSSKFFPLHPRPSGWDITAIL